MPKASANTKTSQFTTIEAASAYYPSADQSGALKGHEKSSTITFQRALGLKDCDLRFDTIKSNIRDIMAKNFDWKLTFKTQPAWEKINAQIKDDFPEVFNSQKSLYETRQYMAKAYHSHAARLRASGSDSKGAERRGRGRPANIPRSVAASVGRNGSSTARSERPRQAKAIANSKLPQCLVPVALLNDLSADEENHPSHSDSDDHVSSKANPSSHSQRPDESHDQITLPPFASADPQQFDAETYDDKVRQFLSGCKPSLEHLLPMFFKLGVETMEDLVGMLDWGDEHRVSWLLKDLGAEWGIKHLHVKALSIAFKAMEEYEASVSAAGLNPRAIAPTEILMFGCL